MNDATSPSLQTLRRYAAAIARQWWIVVLVTALSLAVAGAYVLAQTTTYASAMKIVVGQGEALFGPESVGAVQPFTQTMTDLLESDVVARQVIEDLDLDLTPTELLDRLSVTTRPDTSVLEVTYEDTDRERATRVLAGVGSVFTSLVDEQLASRSEQEDPEGARLPGTQPVTATVFDPAHALPGQVSPRPARTLVIAGALGIIAGLILALLRDALSIRIRTQTEAEDAFGRPVAGLLPPGTVGTRPANVRDLPAELSARIAESVALFTATLRYGRGGAESGVLLVTSARPEEGKTTVVANVSAALAASGRSVVAVEGDLHRPALHWFFNVKPGRPGIAQHLRGDADVTELLVGIDAEPGAARAATSRARVAAGGSSREGGPESDRKPRDDGSSDEPGRTGGGPEESSDEPDGTLEMLPAGTTGDGSARPMSLGAVAELVAALRERADYVVIDSPPLLMSGDVYPFVQLADQIVVVTREGKASREDAREVTKQLRSLGVDDFALVLTESREADRRGYGYGYASA